MLPVKKLRGLSPHFHIHVSVSDLYIPTIGLPILLRRGSSFPYLYSACSTVHCSQHTATKISFMCSQKRNCAASDAFDTHLAHPHPPCSYISCFVQQPPRYWICTLQRKSHLAVPRKEVARPQSQFPHSCVCERFIYSHNRSAYSPSPWVIISLSPLSLFHSTLFTTSHQLLTNASLIIEFKPKNILLLSIALVSSYVEDNPTDSVQSFFNISPCVATYELVYFGERLY